MTKELENIIFGEYYDNLQQYNTEQILHDSNTMSANDFASICKKWALTQNCSIVSTFKHTLGYARVEWYEKGHKDKFNQGREFSLNSEWFKASTEPDAIILACQYILDAQIKCDGILDIKPTECSKIIEPIDTQKHTYLYCAVHKKNGIEVTLDGIAEFDNEILTLSDYLILKDFIVADTNISRKEIAILSLVKLK